MMHSGCHLTFMLSTPTLRSYYQLTTWIDSGSISRTSTMPWSTAISGTTANITRLGGHPYLHYKFTISSYFTYAELRRFHRRVEHPHVDKLANLLSALTFPLSRPTPDVCSKILNDRAHRVRIMVNVLGVSVLSFATTLILITTSTSTYYI